MTVRLSGAKSDSFSSRMKQTGIATHRCPLLQLVCALEALDYCCSRHVDRKLRGVELLSGLERGNERLHSRADPVGQRVVRVSREELQQACNVVAMLLDVAFIDRLARRSPRSIQARAL